MSGNFPFGFQPPDDDPDRKNNPLGDFDMSQLGSMLENLGRMMQSGGGDGSVNWDMANQVARSTQPQKDDNGVSSPERSAVDDATRLANLWLGESESFPATSTESHSWSRVNGWPEPCRPGNRSSLRSPTRCRARWAR